MPLPIVPAPITPTRSIAIEKSPRFKLELSPVYHPQVIAWLRFKVHFRFKNISEKRKTISATRASDDLEPDHCELKSGRESQQSPSDDGAGWEELCEACGWQH